MLVLSSARCQHEDGNAGSSEHRFPFPSCTNSSRCSTAFGVIISPFPVPAGGASAVHLGHNQNLMCSAFSLGKASCKATWQARMSIRNTKLAAHSCALKAGLRAECFEQRKLTEIYLTAGIKTTIQSFFPASKDQKKKV